MLCMPSPPSPPLPRVALSRPPSLPPLHFPPNAQPPGDPSPEEVRSGSPLPSPSVCGCADAEDCQPVGAGFVNLTDSTLNDTLTLTARPPRSPYEFLRGATDSALQCTAITPPYYASTRHKLYLVAEDDFTTYKEWSLSCRCAARATLCARACAWQRA